MADYKLKISAHRAHGLKEGELYYIGQVLAAELKRNGMTNMETDIDNLFAFDVNVNGDVVTLETDSHMDDVTNGNDLVFIVSGIATMKEGK